MYKAYCPASLSFIFKYQKDRDIFKTGSVGISCTLDRGVTAEVSIAPKNEVFLNNKILKMPTLDFVLNNMKARGVRISLISIFPLGYGFGLSSACSLSASYAVNKLLKLGFSKKKLQKFVHVAEIVNHTGLGTVATHSKGGFLYRKSSGLDFDYKKMPFSGKKLWCTLIGKLETPSILRDKKRVVKIAGEAAKALERIKKRKNTSLSDVLDISYEYCKMSGLLDKKVDHMIKMIKKEGKSATMAILGNIVITDRKPLFSQKYLVIECKITEDKVKII